MLDIEKLINDQEFRQHYIATRQRGNAGSLHHLHDLYQAKKALLVQVNQKKQVRNALAKLFAENQDADLRQNLIAKAKMNNEDIKEYDKQIEALQQLFQQQMLALPNAVHFSVTHLENRVITEWVGGQSIVATPLDHKSFGVKYGYLDFAAATAMSGTGFTVLKGAVALLQRALGQFMLDVHTRQHGYEELSVPYLVHYQSLEGNGAFPKFQDEMYAVRDNLYLISTAEVSLVNTLRHTTLKETRLPCKFVAHTPCFRRESGSYGQLTRGIIRQHQFEKVELVQFTLPEASDCALEEIVGHAKAILEALKLPYRIVQIGQKELGFTAMQTYDLEVYLPSQKQYMEVSSCSNCGDFQARRLQAKYKNQQGISRFLHTLNGSGLAIGRTLVAVLEYYQTHTGEIIIPEVLRPYCHYQERLSSISK